MGRHRRDTQAQPQAEDLFFLLRLRKGKTMNDETYSALKLLMEKLDRHVIHATYQEDTKQAYILVQNWLDALSEGTTK